jgi:predicted ATPase
MLAETSLFFGEFEQAREHSEQGISLYDKERHLSDVFLYGNDTWAACHILAANALWYLGYPDQALKRTQVGMSLVRKHSHPSSLNHCLIMATWLHQLRREPQAVLELAQAAVTLSSERGFTFFYCWGTILQGWALAEHSLAGAKGEREVEEGIAQMKHGLAGWKGRGARMWRPYCLGLLAEVYRKVGKSEKGLSLLAEALNVVEQTGERLHEAELYRLKGELLIIRAETEYEPDTWFGDVESCFQQAIEIARHQGAKALEIRSVMSLTRFWGKQGKRQKARTLLQEIYSWFDEGFETADLKEAKMLLDGLA